MSRILRIGTRSSNLATWQAKHVSGLLEERGVKTELVFIKSLGDIDQSTPLGVMGGKGIFTKALDDALLNGEIDLAVHSMKDLPVENPLPIRIAAVLKREDPRDCLVASGETTFLDHPLSEAKIATGSNRRRALWLNRYRNHEVLPLRGNVETRLRKIGEEGWEGAVFAAAGLKRLNLDHHISVWLDWMIPAPAQGAVAVAVREDDPETGNLVALLGDPVTTLCTKVERDLLHHMEGGCSAPVGALARMKNGEVHLEAVALTLDGTVRYDVSMSAPSDDAEELGIRAGQQLLDKGASRIIEDLRKEY